MDWLSAAIRDRRPFPYGEALVRFDGDHAVISGPGGPAGGAEMLPGDADAIRSHLKTDAAGRYRPLPGAVGMRPGWQTSVPVDRLLDLLDAVYPLAPAHIRLHGDGALRRVPLDEVLARQSGRYELTASATPAQRDAAVAALCAGCVRTPAWDGGYQALPEPVIPCPEACSVLVALCRELVVQPDAADPPDGSGAPFADFAHPANPVARRARQFLAG